MNARHSASAEAPRNARIRWVASAVLARGLANGRGAETVSAQTFGLRDRVDTAADHRPRPPMGVRHRYGWRHHGGIRGRYGGGLAADRAHALVAPASCHQVSGVSEGAGSHRRIDCAAAGSCPSCRSPVGPRPSRCRCRDAVGHLRTRHADGREQDGVASRRATWPPGASASQLTRQRGTSRGAPAGRLRQPQGLNHSARTRRLLGGASRSLTWAQAGLPPTRRHPQTRARSPGGLGS